MTTSTQQLGMIATTGHREIPATRDFNRRLENLLALETPVHHLNDPAASRAERRKGTESRPAPVLLPHGVNRTIRTPLGSVSVREFVPEQVNGVYLHIHGGGWTLGSADEQDGRLWDIAVRAQVAVVSVDYRLAPENPYPAAPDDCHQAALWVVEHAAREYGSNRLVIGGESSGANLVVSTLLRLRDRNGLRDAFRAANLVFGVYDLSMTPSHKRWGGRNLLISTPIMQWFTDNYAPGMTLEQRRNPDLSPMYADLTGMPPARFVVGTQDLLLDDSLFMASRWRMSGAPTNLEIVAEAPHGFISFPLAVAQQEIAAQEEFIAEAIR